MIIGAAHDIINSRKLTISYGVKPICVGTVQEQEGTEGIFHRCKEAILSDPELDPSPGKGDMVIFTAGTPLGRSGTTNSIKMKRI
jgi:pyruvate kinase